MPNLPDPAGLSHCHVTGKFAYVAADTFADTGDNPDWIPMQGTAEIQPNFLNGKDVNVANKMTFFHEPIVVTLDADGDISLNGIKGVYLLAGGTGITPVGFNYLVTFHIHKAGTTKETSYGPFNFDVVPGGEVDLTDAIPVAAFEGVPTAVGPEGPPGHNPITVSATAPSSPGDGDIWFDIS
jgi:hypothetical protein